MAKFINTERKDTIQSLVEGFKDKLKNPYYVFSDKKPTITTYYNRNSDKSSVDQSTGLEYSALGKDSPVKYNKIHDMYLYGLDKVQVQLEVGDYGMESADIEGEAIILPNTIIPAAGDYFSISYLKDKMLFKVTSVTNDTVDNDSNFYKINYKLDQITDDVINSQVVEEFTMIVENEGTNYKTIIRNNDYKFIEQIEYILDILKQYYKDLFYSERVQTFILNHDSKYFYDPFMLEFIIRHNLINTVDGYLYICHQIRVPATFSLDYDRTFFRYIEMPDKKDIDKMLVHSQATGIDDVFCIMNDRPEDYYRVSYINTSNTINYNLHIMNNFDTNLIQKIRENSLYDIADSSLMYRNIIIKHLNNIDITVDDINTLDDVQYNKSISLFYEIPIVIYILEKIIKNLIQ